MFTKDDILARLQNGETADNIAQEMADALNEAQAEKSALDAEKVAKEKEEARMLNAKRTAINGMLDAICDYFVAAGEDELIDEVKEIDTDKVIELIDGAIEMTKSLEKLKGLQFPLLDFAASPSCECMTQPKEATFTSNNVDFNPDAVIKAFLKGI